MKSLFSRFLDLLLTNLDCCDDSGWKATWLDSLDALLPRDWHSCIELNDVSLGYTSSGRGFGWLSVKTPKAMGTLPVGVALGGFL